MRFLLIALGFLCSNRARAEDDCTFSQSDQKKIRASVQERHPGATLDVDSRALRWTTPEAETTLVYGGCVDLGSEITESRPRSAKRSEKEVLARALMLAERFWTPDLISAGAVATETLRRSVGKKQWRRVLEPGQVRYEFRDPTYTVLAVTHRLADGKEVVRLEWVGAF